MSVAYVDTSYLVAIAFGESAAERLLVQLDEFEDLYTAALTEAELRSAFSREGIVDGPEQALRGIAWILPDRRLTPEIATVLAAGYLRGADLWHVACALYLSAGATDLAFLTLDRAQSVVAAELGLRVAHSAEIA